MVLNIDAIFDRKNDLRFVNIFVYRLKNSDFIFEGKMAELSRKQNLLI